MEFYFKYFDFSPIDLASINGHDDIVSFLIENGADFNPNKKGANSPLLYAIQENQNKVVDVLISHHANINHSNGIVLFIYL